MPVRIFLLLACYACNAIAQVGIGTANVDPSALLQLESTNGAFVLPRMTDAQMAAIPAPLTGSLLYNNTENLPYFKSPSGWSSFDLSSNPTIILMRSGGTFSTSTTVAYFMGLTSAHVQSASAAYFSVPSAGKVKVTRSGVYLMSVSLSTSNLPSGNRNYYLAAYLNGNLIGYLSRSRLEMTATDYWGTTGTLMYPANAGDEFTFKYFINYTSTLNCVFQTICITKLN